jgi:hypothetical protein
MPFVPDTGASGSDPFSRNQAYAKPAPSQGYLTRLPPQEEARFHSWVKQNNVPFDSSPHADYDMRGFYKAMQAGDPRATTGVNQNDGKLHFGDYWKTPYHKSFSAESQWATADAPKWNEKDQLISPDGKVVFDERAQSQKGRFVPDAVPAKQRQPESSTISDALKAYYGATLEPLLAMGSGAIAAPVSGLAGIGQGLKNLASPGMPAGDRVQSIQQAMTYQPRTQVGQAMTGAVAYPFEKLAQAGDYVGSGIGVSQEPDENVVRRADRANIPRRMEGSPLAGAIANTAIQSIPALLTRRVAADASARPSPVVTPAATGEGAAAGEAAATAERATGLAKVSEAAPTKEALKAASQAAYKRAEDAGAVISKDSFAKAQEVTASLLEKEGIDPTLHPSTTAALKRFGAEKGPVTLEKLETLRRIAKDAESTQVPADRRLAGKLVDTIDNYAETLAQKDFNAGSPEAIAALKEARDLWSRSRKAETLDELVNRAELSAPNFSASGMENALRTEFRNLAKNKARMRVFTAEEQAAIRRVATGGATENALRMLGKFAPTGAISTAISGTAGFMAGGPVGAMALPAMGGAARYAATRMTMRNVGRASELVRRGPNALASRRSGNALKYSTEGVKP